VGGGGGGGGWGVGGGGGGVGGGGWLGGLGGGGCGVGGGGGGVVGLGVGGGGCGGGGVVVLCLFRWVAASSAISSDLPPRGAARDRFVGCADPLSLKSIRPLAAETAIIRAMAKT